MQRQFTIAAAIVAGCFAIGTSSTAGAAFDIPSGTGLFEPSFRGQPNTTYFGWDTFGDPSNDGVINDSTPDIGAATSASIVGNTVSDHVLGGNIYTMFTTLNETVTAPTSGTPGQGFTTLIIQAVANGTDLNGDIQFTTTDGVAPISVAQALNADGSGQLWAKYEIPGNLGSYAFTMTTIPGGSPFSTERTGYHMSIDKLTVDTYWSESGFAADSASVPEPATATAVLFAGAALLARRCRRTA